MNRGGAVTGQPRTWLRLEGLAVLAASLLFYRWQLESWWTFLLLFFVPDVTMVGYAAGPAIGARVYNLAHNYVGPVFLVCWALSIGRQDVVPYALIWTAHIGFDRALGFGLKYQTGFGHTHLGQLPRAAQLKSPGAGRFG
jgi:hypothetical protein